MKTMKKILKLQHANLEDIVIISKKVLTYWTSKGSILNRSRLNKLNWHLGGGRNKNAAHF